MMLCKHMPHTVINWIKEPKYSTHEILISKDKVDAANEHLLIKFTNCPSIPDWFYMSRKMVRKCRTQTNGNGVVYVVPLSKREPFVQIKPCEHMNAELF